MRDKSKLHLNSGRCTYPMRTTPIFILGSLLLPFTSFLHADTLTFQEGVYSHSQTTDTWLQGAVGNANHDTSLVIEWDGSDAGGQNFLIIRFDEIFGSLQGQIQPSDVITSATLSYTSIDPGDAATVNEIEVDWSPPSPTTFNSFGAAAGVQSEDYGLEVGSALGATGPQSIDVLHSIEQWAVNPASNRGWIFRPTGGTNGAVLRSSEATQTTERPKLTVVINEGAPPPASVLRGPYLQRVTADSITVRWRTDTATTSSVRFGVEAGSLTGSVSTSTTTIDHEVALTGLMPDTRYYYSIGTADQDLAGDSANHFFETSPIPGSATPFSVWAIGDFGTANSSQALVRDAYYSYSDSTYTDLWLLLGDNAYLSGTDAQYQAAFFNVYQQMLIQTPFASTRGNHETMPSVYYGLVTNPTDGVSGGVASGTEAFYSFDFGNAHFICLDSEGSDLSTSAPMLTWLELDLASTAQDWIVTFFHHPPYTKGTHDSDQVADSGGRMRDMRENALPILEAGGCDLVLSGHSHVYERSFLIDGHDGNSGTWNPALHIVDGGNGDPLGDGGYQKDSSPNQGTVYIVMGSSGTVGSGSLDHPAMYYSGSVLGSLALNFSGSNLGATMVRSDGSFEDVFSISKGPPPDCNGNGVADSVDLASGTSTDCNLDGIPDECQGPDDNGDGVLDVCQGSAFIRGDANQDGGMDISDPVWMLQYLFATARVDCVAAFDFNGDELLDLSDVIGELSFIFQGGTPPEFPYPDCGVPAGTIGGCYSFSVCP